MSSFGRQGTDRVDLYLLNGLGRGRGTKRAASAPAERRVRAGQIQWPGFSFHVEFFALKEIVDVWDR